MIARTDGYLRPLHNWPKVNGPNNVGKVIGESMRAEFLPSGPIATYSRTNLAMVDFKSVRNTLYTYAS